MGRRATTQIGAARDLAKINPVARTHLGKVIRFRRIAFEPSDVAERGRPPGRPRRLSGHAATEPADKLPMRARSSFGAFGEVLSQDRRDGRRGVLQFARTRHAAGCPFLHGSANDAHLFPCFLQVTRPRRRPRRPKEPHRVLPMMLRLPRGVVRAAFFGGTCGRIPLSFLLGVSSLVLTHNPRPSFSLYRVHNSQRR